MKEKIRIIICLSLGMLVLVRSLYAICDWACLGRDTHLLVIGLGSFLMLIQNVLHYLDCMRCIFIPFFSYLWKTEVLDLVCTCILGMGIDFQSNRKIRIGK